MRRFRFIVRALGAVCLLLAQGMPTRAADWQVAEAPLRYKVDLERKPTHPSAGYFVHLPDGGILHGTSPATVVTTEDGKVLPSYLLWQNSESGFSIVFADPGSAARSVYIYTLSSRLPQLWNSATGITPSAILCAFPGRDTLTSAQALAKLGRVDPAVHVSNDTGVPKAPFSIGGDDTGRPKPAAFYLLSYLDALVPGEYWIAPFTRNGQTEILIDGIKLTPKARSKLWGGDGANVTFTAGLHRVEVFQTAPGAGPYASDLREGGLMYLTWRLPKEKLSGKVESRVISGSEIAHSGACNLTAVESRDGAPVAVAVPRPNLSFWFDNEEPLVNYELNALNPAQNPGATYTWSFPEGGTLEGPKVQWLFPGFRESKVKLTVKSPKGVSTSVVSFFGFSTQPTSLDKAPTRETFRNVLAGMLEAYPRSPDPVAEWGDAWWNNILRTIDGGEGYPLLLRLFTNHLEAARKKLPPVQLNALQDLFLDLAQRENPRDTLQWIQRFQPVAANSPRQLDLKIREGELQMYYLGDRKQAEKIFTALSTLNNEYGERAKIRLGDIAFMDGDLNKATSFYADVQNRARSRRNAAPVSGGLVANQLIQEGAAGRTPAPNTPNTPITPPIPDLKGGALQEVSLSENVRTLLEKDFFMEARQNLLVWENEFPLSKVSGDYILRESELYIKTADWKRAQPMLEAYCREIDASSYLPDAASMLIACVTGAKEPPASIRDIIEKVKGRLKYHPVATELDRFLSTAPKPAK